MEFIRDLYTGLKRHRLWCELAKLELKSNYQGSVLGVSWIVLALMIKVGMLSIVYSMVLDKDFSEYILFLALGVLTWSFISSTIINSAMIFRKAANFLMQMKLEHSIFVLQNIYKESLILILYQLFAIPLVFVIKGESVVSLMWIWVFLGYIVIILIALFASFWIGWLSARYRDIQPVLNSMVMIIFLITPVLWPPPEKFSDSLYFQLNPFYHLLELIRSPIIDGVVPALSWAVASAILIINVVLSILIYPKIKNKLVLWL